MNQIRGWISKGTRSKRRPNRCCYILLSILMVVIILGSTKSQLTAQRVLTGGTLKINDILKPFTIGDKGRYPVEFEVTAAGKVEARAEWIGAAGTLTLILNGPGQTGYYARQSGGSPLSLSFAVTNQHIAKGTKWSLSVVNFGTGSAEGKVAIRVPSIGTTVTQITQQPYQQARVTQSVAKSIKVLWPNGGEKLEIGDPYTFCWQSTGLGNSILSVELQGGPGSLTHVLAYPIAVTNSYVYRIRPDITAGYYKFKVATKDGSIQDMSDGTLNIVRPAVNLHCGMESQDQGFDSRGWRHYKIWVIAYNNGTATLKNVMLEWIVEKNGYMLEQKSGGVETMFPDTKYRLEVFSMTVPDSSDGSIKVRAFLDPHNQQMEKESLRNDNTNSINLQY